MKNLRENFFFGLLLLAGAFMVTNCATPSPKPINPRVGYIEKGIASWYGPGFHGKLTASGERYDMHQMTAAHKRLPLGTIVEVRSLHNGRTVKVKINDRGPFVRGRIIDLSYAAAKSLKMVKKGTDRVRVKVIKKSPVPGPFWVQVSSFEDLKEARAMGHELKGNFPRVRVVKVKLSTGKWYRVQVGEFSTENKAKAAARKLRTHWGVRPLVLDP